VAGTSSYQCARYLCLPHERSQAPLSARILEVHAN